MNNSDTRIKHVLHDGKIYAVDFSAPAAVWTVAMPFADWAAQQSEILQTQFPNLHGGVQLKI